jgi:hypothetical protein
MNVDRKRRIAAVRRALPNRISILFALSLLGLVVICLNLFKNNALGLSELMEVGATGRMAVVHSVDYLQPGYNLVPQKTQYHVLLPCDGTHAYHEWQARVFYYWLRRIKESKDPKAMGGFTRLLHSGAPDVWMDEVPTVVVDPLPRDLQRVADGYAMLNRPYAVQQWVTHYMAKIPEHFVLLAEPDHIFIRAPPLWATYSRPSAYPMGFIDTQNAKHRTIFQKFNVKNVPLKQWHPVGPSPLMISKKQLGLLVNPWLNISFALRQDSEAHELFGWTTELYAFSIAAAITPGGPRAMTLRPEFMVQPPWDSTLKGKNGRRAAFIHYTYSQDFDSEGTFTPAVVGKYHFDKRDYVSKYPPLKPRRPPRGCSNEASKMMMKLINIASTNLDGWAVRAYLKNEPVPGHWGVEGDVLDWADPEETEVGAEDVAEYSYGDVLLDDIDDIDDIEDIEMDEALEDDDYE